MTLTPEDKERIRAEENERQRVRAELEAEAKNSEASEVDAAWETVKPKYKNQCIPCPFCKKPVRKDLQNQGNGCASMIGLFILGCFFWPIWIAIPILLVRKKNIVCGWCQKQLKS